MEHDSSRAQNSKRQKRKPRKISETYLHNSGLYYLERFSASKSHFITVMSRKVKRSCMVHTEQNYDQCVQMVHNLADKFEKTGLLNDALYTQGVVISLRRRGLSRNAILNKMRAKGIGQEQAALVLDQINDEECLSTRDFEIKAALKLAKKKKVGPFSYLNLRKDEQETEITPKILGYFARGGFSYDIARHVLDMSLEEADEILFA